ncbi:MAG: ferredoxin [Clostridia bacterium]|nr:ferredoxin [Clostridia bacterium]
MKAKVNKDMCISCGICVTVCPEVFAFDDNSLAESIVDEIPKECLSAAEEARDSCPVSVIDIYE